MDGWMDGWMVGRADRAVPLNRWFVTQHPYFIILGDK